MSCTEQTLKYWIKLFKRKKVESEEEKEEGKSRKKEKVLKWPLKNHKIHLLISYSGHNNFYWKYMVRCRKGVGLSKKPYHNMCTLNKGKKKGWIMNGLLIICI